METTREESSKAIQLAAFFESLGSAAEDGDTNAYTGLFLPNASMFLPNRPPLVGREEIGAFFNSFISKMVLSMDVYEQRQIDIVGDVAMVRSHSDGHYLVKSTGNKIHYVQKYLDVLRYTENQWRMSYHVASSSVMDSGIWDQDWENE
jgi:uncharacterized protein (TIGR02246 family)